MKILYYDCFSGISGDMHLGAMVDLGVDADFLQSELRKLNVSDYSINIEKDSRHGISGTRVDVIYTGATNNSKAGSSHGEHHHRNLKDILDILSASELSEEVKSRSEKMFRKLAEAEAKIHNKSIDEIHFHEIGAIDSIVDIVGAAVCIESIKPDRILCSTIELGGGFVECAHGKFPVPAPATAELLAGAPVRTGTVDKETTTPTGAVILAANVDAFTPMKDFRISKTAYGIGQQEMEIPNVLRVFLGESDKKLAKSQPDSSEALMIECNIDDMNPEIYGFIMEELFASGADDVYLSPITMKKIRPASKLSVLCKPELEEQITDFILTQTTSLGVRKYIVSKSMLQREIETIETKYGAIRIKHAISQGKRIKSKPEYDDCIRIAREQTIPIQEVYKEINRHLSQ